MLRTLLKPLQLLVQAFTDAVSPQQIAAGFALGMMLGLVPKGNLIAAGLSVVLVATHVNLAAATVAAVAFSWVGMLLDPLAHRLGLALLTHPGFEPFWTWLYNLPAAPWTRFNNTVVLGNLLLAAVLAGPVYALARWAFVRYRPWMLEQLTRLGLSQLVSRVEVLTRWSLR